MASKNYQNHTYTTAKQRLEKSNKQGRPRVRLTPNTYLEWSPKNDKSIDVWLHRTIIVHFNPDGTTVYNSGGWRTDVTRRRMEECGLPNVVLSVKDHQMLLTVRGNRRKDGTRIVKTVAFEDGIIVGKRGGLTLPSGGSKREAKRQLKLRKSVKKYCDDYIEALSKGEVPAPGLGDCMMCSFRDKDGVTMGDLGHHDHLLEHIKESYYVPSLLANAIKEDRCLAPIATMGLSYWWSGEERAKTFASFALQPLKKSLRKYLHQRLDLAM